MSHKEKPRRGHHHARSVEANMVAIGIAIGISIGVALGLVLDNLALGIALGTAIGAGLGASGIIPSHRDDARGERREDRHDGGH